MAVSAADQPSQEIGHFSLSGISVLMALSLAVWEVYFFWGAGRNLLGSLEGSVGIFTPDRLGFNMAWLVFFYLAFQLLSIPFAITPREHFVGVLDGLASVVPLLVAAVAIVGRPELLKTSGRWEAAILLVLICLADLIGGYAVTVALSRRTIGFGGASS
jgi:heme A synthase